MKSSDFRTEHLCFAHVLRSGFLSQVSSGWVAGLQYLWTRQLSAKSFANTKGMPPDGDLKSSDESELKSPHKPCNYKEWKSGERRWEKNIKGIVTEKSYQWKSWTIKSRYSTYKVGLLKAESVVYIGERLSFVNTMTSTLFFKWVNFVISSY